MTIVYLVNEFCAALCSLGLSCLLHVRIFQQFKKRVKKLLNDFKEMQTRKKLRTTAAKVSQKKELIPITVNIHQS